MKTKKYFGIVVILVMLLTLAITSTVSAAATKVDVCHLDKDMGVYFLINISEAAFQAHVDHGDAAPGQAVPEMTGKVFTSTCGVVDQKELIATVIVPSNGTVVKTPALTGSYLLEATGTFYYTGIVPSDAKCSLRGSIWVDNGTYSQPYYQYGLQIVKDDGTGTWPLTPMGWTEPCNLDHKYTTNYTFTGVPLGLWIYDNAYSDNSGSLTVKIFLLH